MSSARYYVFVDNVGQLRSIYICSHDLDEVVIGRTQSGTHSCHVLSLASKSNKLHFLMYVTRKECSILVTKNIIDEITFVQFSGRVNVGSQERELDVD